METWTILIAVAVVACLLLSITRSEGYSSKTSRKKASLPRTSKKKTAATIKIARPQQTSKTAPFSPTPLPTRGNWDENEDDPVNDKVTPKPLEVDETRYSNVLQGKQIKNGKKEATGPRAQVRPGGAQRGNPNKALHMPPPWAMARGNKYGLKRRLGIGITTSTPRLTATPTAAPVTSMFSTPTPSSTLPVSSTNPASTSSVAITLPFTTTPLPTTTLPVSSTNPAPTSSVAITLPFTTTPLPTTTTPIDDEDMEEDLVDTGNEEDWLWE